MPPLQYYSNNEYKTIKLFNGGNKKMKGKNAGKNTDVQLMGKNSAYHKNLLLRSETIKNFKCYVLIIHARL